MCTGPSIPDPPKKPIRPPQAKRKKAPVMGKKKQTDNKRKKMGARRLTIALGGENKGNGSSGLGIPK